MHTKFKETVFPAKKIQVCSNAASSFGYRIPFGSKLRSENGDLEPFNDINPKMTFNFKSSNSFLNRKWV